MEGIMREIRQGLDGLEAVDVHSHLGTGGVWKAKTLAHIVSYHWLSVELARAKGVRIQADPGEDPEGYMQEVVPLFPAIRNTVNHYAVMAILRDLYGLDDRTLTADNWRDVDARVREQSQEEDRLVKVLDRSGISKVMVCFDAPGMPHPSGRCVPYGYAEPMFAFEHAGHLDRILDKGAEAPGSVEGLADAIRARVAQLAGEQGARALHNWVRGDWVYQADVGASDVDGIYKRVIAKEDVAREDRGRLMSFTADVTAAAAAEHGMVIQLFHGMMTYTEAIAAPCIEFYNPEFLPALTRHFWKNRKTKYDLFYGTRRASHEMASLARVYANVSPSGAWWHGFSPTTLAEFFRDRLELLPNTAWNAFYSDGYMVEWLYGKLAVTKNRLAFALAGMVDEGFMTRDDALDIAKMLLSENAKRIYGLE